jgi:hypothetical protein
MSSAASGEVVFEVELGDHVPERIVVTDGGVTLTFPVPDATRERLQGQVLRLVIVTAGPA